MDRETYRRKSIMRLRAWFLSSHSHQGVVQYSNFFYLVSLFPSRRFKEIRRIVYLGIRACRRARFKITRAFTRSRIYSELCISLSTPWQRPVWLCRGPGSIELLLRYHAQTPWASMVATVVGMVGVLCVAKPPLHSYRNST